MSLRINSVAPNFKAETNHGPIDFHEWIGDSWVLFFSHPKDHTPVCTTELSSVAQLAPEWEKRGVKTIGLSVDNANEHRLWLEDIVQVSGHRVNFPLVSDPKLEVAKVYGMLDADVEGNSDGRKAIDNETVRCVFIIFQKKIKAILTYPMNVGRNFDEILRLIDGLQLAQSHNVATPANWRPGNDVIVPVSVKDADADAKYGADNIKRVKPYLRLVHDPAHKK